MSTDLSGSRAISAMQSPWRMESSGRSRRALAGRNDVGCSAMRAIRFMDLPAPPLRQRKVSQAGLAVKRTRVNAPLRDALLRRRAAPAALHLESLPQVRTQAVGGVT